MHNLLMLCEAKKSSSGDRVSYNSTKQMSASMTTCRSQKDLDYVVKVVTKWQVGHNLKKEPPSNDRSNLLWFRQKHPLKIKYIKQFAVESITVPSDVASRVVVRRLKDGVKKGIVVAIEQVFDAIDEWHRQNGHMGQERTWIYCKGKYHNITQDFVKIYCETCPSCMKKNPTTKNEKGSRKPILSKNFQVRYQIDLIDMSKLRKRDPFGVLMQWIMTV